MELDRDVRAPNHLDRHAGGGSARRHCFNNHGKGDLDIASFCLSGYPHDEEATRFGDIVMPAFR
jgi:hypothetical protein